MREELLLNEVAEAGFKEVAEAGFKEVILSIDFKREKKSYPYNLIYC